MNTERDARKKTLENRIKLYEQMQTLCYEESTKLQAELAVIEDQEADEDERRWKQQRARFIQTYGVGI